MSFLSQYFTRGEGSDKVIVVTDIPVCRCQPRAGLQIFPRVWRQQEGKYSSRSTRGATFPALALFPAGSWASTAQAPLGTCPKTAFWSRG